MQLQDITAFNPVTAAITPLKKTPPHYMEEFANLSPAKPHKSTVHPTPSQSGLALTNLTSQSSLGFHPYLASNPPENTEGGSEEGQSDSSTDSESDTPQETSHEECILNIHQKHLRLSNHQQHDVESQVSPKKKRKSSQPCSSLTASKKHRSVSGGFTSVAPKDEVAETAQVSQVLLSASNEGRAAVLSGLLVRIPLVDLKVPDSTQQQLEKPKATVEPIVRNPTTSRTPNRRNTADMMETEDHQNRDRYSRLLDDYVTGPVHDYGGRPRPHEGRWDRDGSRDHRSYGLMSRTSSRGSDYGRGHGWERDHYRGGAGSDDYWSDISHYESSRDSQRGRGYSRHPNERKRDPEYYMQEARRRKKEADKIMVCILVYSLKKVYSAFVRFKVLRKLSYTWSLLLIS